MPNYHRLDIGINKHIKKRKGEVDWNFSIYNAYAHLNPYYVRYKFSGSSSSASNGNFQIVSIFQFIPSLSWYRKF